MKKVKMGIIGAGHIAKTFAKAVPMTSNVELVAVGSRTKEKAEDFAKEFAIKKAYGTYQDLLNDTEIEAVYVATPHSHHYEFVKMCLENNKSVICEKPMVLCEKHITELMKIAKEKDLLLMEAMWTRFLPSIEKAHEWIDAGEIGDVKFIDASFSFRAKVNPEGRLFNKALAGGATYDVGVYVIEFAMDFAGADLVDKDVMAIYGETDVDTQATINLKFENNVMASVKCGLDVALKNDAYVFGTEGYIFFDNFHCGHRICLHKKGCEVVEFVADNRTSPEGFKFEIEHFGNLLIDGKKESPRIPFKHNIESSKIFEIIANKG